MVAVKIQRPGLVDKIALDAFVLRNLSKILKFFSVTRSDLVAILDQIVGNFTKPKKIKESTSGIFSNSSFFFTFLSFCPFSKLFSVLFFRLEECLRNVITFWRQIMRKDLLNCTANLVRFWLVLLSTFHNFSPFTDCFTPAPFSRSGPQKKTIKGIKVPKIYRKYSTRGVLTMEVEKKLKKKFFFYLPNARIFTFLLTFFHKLKKK